MYIYIIYNVFPLISQQKNPWILIKTLSSWEFAGFWASIQWKSPWNPNLDDLDLHEFHEKSIEFWMEFIHHKNQPYPDAGAGMFTYIYLQNWAIFGVSM